MNFKGKTVKEAILKAVESLGVNEEELEIKVVQEPVRGILGIGQKDAQIEVSLKETTVAEMLDIEETVVIEENKVENESVAIKSGIKEEKIARATAFIKEIISQLGYTVEYFIREEQNFVIINIRGKNAGKLIGKRGETLYAIQYLVNIAANKKDEANLKFLIDIEDFRKKREKTLINLANKLARQVKESGNKVVLEPMNPLERKIIHTALQKFPDIDTSSEGEEGQRHIVISLKAQ
ncbi:MAG: protein jag [Fusobacteria bacterium]|nr:protein jag [Fusobacteriota bacterium]